MNAIIHRLGGKRWWAAEVAIRTLGVALLALCAATTFWLYNSVHQLPRHEASPGELAAGLVAVECWCLGSTLLVQGQGLFRLVPDPRKRRSAISMQETSR